MDQKLKNKRGEIHAFKEGIRPEIVAIGSSRGRRLKASWERVFGCGVVASINAKNPLEFGFKLSFKIGHDLRAIDHDRPRSSVDRAPDSSKLSLDDRGINFARKDPRSRLDRATIAVRSDRDRGVLPRVAYAVQ